MVSIIISTLNNAEGLTLTLNALSSLKGIDFEVIIIDGGSTDSTISILSAENSLIKKWISEDDFGIYDAWNKGLQFADGEYIAFLGGGDYYLQDGLIELLDAALKAPQANFISCKAKLVKGNDIKRVIGKPLTWEDFSKHMKVVHVGALHSRDLFNANGKFDTSFKVAGDYDFLLRARNILKPLFVDHVCVVMQMGGVSQIGRLSLHEAELAKIKNMSRSKFLAKIDRFWATVIQVIGTFLYK